MLSTTKSASALCCPAVSCTSVACTTIYPVTLDDLLRLSLWNICPKASKHMCLRSVGYAGWSLGRSCDFWSFGWHCYIPCLNVEGGARSWAGSIARSRDGRREQRLARRQTRGSQNPASIINRLRHAFPQTGILPLVSSSQRQCIIDQTPIGRTPFLLMKWSYVMCYAVHGVHYPSPMYRYRTRAAGRDKCFGGLL